MQPSETRVARSNGHGEAGIEPEHSVSDTLVQFIGLGNWGSTVVAEREQRATVDGASSESDLFVLIGSVERGGDAELVAALRHLGRIAPDAGRLVVTRLPGQLSGPEDRALGLAALNEILQVPSTSVFLIQPTEGIGIRADRQSAEAAGRVFSLLDLGERTDGAVMGIRRAAVIRHFSTPGFVGWREFELQHDMIATGGDWHSRLGTESVAWQPQGFDWSKAQAIIPFVKAPLEWLETDARMRFDSLVEAAWQEAAPCSMTPALYAADRAVAVLVSTGLPFPTALLQIRDGVEADRERIVEKKREATTLIPLADDFVRPKDASDTGPRTAMDDGRTPAVRPEPVMEAEPEPVVEAEPEPVVEAEPEPVVEAEPEPVVEAEPEPVLEAEPEPVVEAEPEPVVEAEPEPVVEVAPEPVIEVAPEPVVEAEPEPMAAQTEAAFDPEPETPAWGEPEETPAEYPEEAEPSSRIVEAPAAVAEPAAEAIDAEPYDQALGLAIEMTEAEEFEKVVDLARIRYALYDMLEVLRTDPVRLLNRVFDTSARDDYFASHHVNVAILAMLTADQTETTLTDVVDVGTAAMIHDIGMAESRDAWDNEMRLAPKVFDKSIRKHPEHGFERLQEITGMTGAIARMVLEEHERMDGTGYPEGLTGEAIDPGARILAACDTLEALTHPRPFREHLPLGEALSRLQILGQYTLDPAVVQTLTDVIGRWMPLLDSE